MTASQREPNTLVVGIIGTRGIPNRYGGFERFVELLVDDECWQGRNVRFRVYGEAAGVERNPWTSTREVGVLKTKRPLLYYIRSALDATRECDIVLCCGVGLSFFAWWVVLWGRALIVNPDGCEWRRSKWSPLGRLLIRAMYTPALLAARRIVIDAEGLREDFGAALGNKARYIAYQAPAPRTPALESGTRQRLGLKKPYLLVIARLEPENNILAIVQAFRALQTREAELIVVGGTKTGFYQTSLAAFEGDGVRFVGAIYEQEVLDQLRANCIAYLHGHSVGGTNPSLLEALATVRGRLLCHDNKYNREVAADEAGYFADAEALTRLLRPIVVAGARPDHTAPSNRIPSRDPRFLPDTIAHRYLELFEDIRAAR